MYMISDKDKATPTPIFRGLNNSISIRLPAGNSNDQFRSQITVVVSDDIGETNETYIYPVIVSIIITKIEDKLKDKNINYIILE